MARSLKRNHVWLLLALALPLTACTSLCPQVLRASSETSPAITGADLQRHLYAIADDSMRGRRPGTEGGERAERYLALHAQRLGLLPAGEDGTYFQPVPLVRYSLDDSLTALRADTAILHLDEDFVVFPPAGQTRSLEAVQVIFGGRLGEVISLSPEEIKDRAVVLLPPADDSPSVPEFASGPLSGAAAVVLISEGPFHGYVSFLKRSRTPYLRRPHAVPERILATPEAAARLLGQTVDERLPVGTRGGTLQGEIVYGATPLPSRNVIAVLPGSDADLRHAYVVLGAHSDHLGVQPRPLDHDSVRAFAAIAEQLRRHQGGRPLTAEQQKEIRLDLDSLRRRRPPRMDSISNGADDNASGAVALLEIAEALVHAPERPRRSILFLWPAAEEIGLRGSTWFVESPTVPLESILVYINLDMIGRGGADDLPEGGPDYVQVIGSRQRSSELGDLVEAANRTQTKPLQLDAKADGVEHGSSAFCRSDQLPFALRVPVVFFTTGMHSDYHEITDEAQYIDYTKLERITRVVRDLALRLANRPRPLRLDRAPLDPSRVCRMVP